MLDFGVQCKLQSYVMSQKQNDWCLKTSLVYQLKITLNTTITKQCDKKKLNHFFLKSFRIFKKKKAKSCGVWLIFVNDSWLR